MREIRFGIIGCGAISGIHCEALSQIQGVKLVAVSDVNASAAECTGKKYSVDYYTDYLELLSRKDIDVVNICTPSGLRGEIAVNAAKHGKNILAEKPLEVNLEKIDEIIKACEENNVLLGAIYNYRYKADSRKLYELISSGSLGRMIMGDAYIKWYRPKTYYTPGGWRGTWKMDGGGALMNQSIHTIDLLQWFMGPIDTVFGYTEKLVHTEIETEDTAVAVLKFKSGALGVIEGATSIYPGFKTRIEISGENGTVILEDGILKTVVLQNQLKKSSIDTSNCIGKGSGGASNPLDVGIEEHKKQMEDFIESVREKKPFWLDGYEARKAVQVIRAIYESSETGRPVKL